MAAAVGFFSGLIKLGREPYPSRRIDIPRVMGRRRLLGEPCIWRDHQSVGPGVKPRAPPAERAVGDDVCARFAHQIHVVVFGFAAQEMGFWMMSEHCARVIGIV